MQTTQDNDLTAELSAIDSRSGDGVDRADAIDPPESDDFDDDSDFAPQPKKKLGKLSIALIAAVLVGAGFLGGVELQKNHGSSTTSGNFAGLGGARAGGGEGFSGFGGGAPGGGTGTGSGAGTGSGTGTGTGSGSGTGSSTGTASGTSTDSPSVIGTVVSVNSTTLVVKNLAGTSVTVTLSSTTTITKSATAPDLAAGQTVSVVGTTGSDGTVTATAVTVR